MTVSSQPTQSSIAIPITLVDWLFNLILVDASHPLRKPQKEGPIYSPDACQTAIRRPCVSITPASQAAFSERTPALSGHLERADVSP